MNSLNVLSSLAMWTALYLELTFATLYTTAWLSSHKFWLPWTGLRKVYGEEFHKDSAKERESWLENLQGGQLAATVEMRPWVPPTGPCLPAWCLPRQLGPLCYHSCACTTDLLTVPHCFQHGKWTCPTTLNDLPVCIKPRQDLRHKEPE